MKKLIALSFFSLIVFTGFSNGENGTKSQNSIMKIRNRAARPDIPGTLVIEFGYNLFQNDDPSIETKIMGNRTLNFYYLYDIRIANTKFFFIPGIGVGLDRYKFDEDITLNKVLVGDSTEFNTIGGGGVKKSMLITNYIDIPLEFMFYANPSDIKRSFKVGAGFKVGYLFNSHTKIKQELDDDMSVSKVQNGFNLNKFRYGVTGRIGVGGFNVFYYQSLNTLFQDKKGPLGTEVNNITVGLSFTGF